MCFFIAAAECFLAELAAGGEAATTPLLALAPTCAADPEDLWYRLCRGFGEHLRRRIRDERIRRASAA